MAQIFSTSQREYKGEDVQLFAIFIDISVSLYRYSARKAQVSFRHPKWISNIVLEARLEGEDRHHGPRATETVGRGCGS